MAKIARTMSGKSPLSGRAKGGKLALFEVLAAEHQTDTDPEPVPPPTPQPATPPATSPAMRPFARSVTPPAAQAPAAPAVQARRFEPSPVLAEPPVIVPRQGAISGAAIAIAAASVVIVVGLIYAMGGSSPSQESIAADPDQVMPEVLDVNSPGARVEAGGQETLARSHQPMQQSIQQAPPVTSFPVTARRTNGLNYVLIESYHPSELDRAEATAAALAAAGIHVTIERDIRGWGSNLCVVGVEGFERIRHNAQYQTYVQRLMDVSNRHRLDRKIKTFDPRPIQWNKG